MQPLRQVETPRVLELTEATLHRCRRVSPLQFEYDDAWDLWREMFPRNQERVRGLTRRAGDLSLGLFTLDEFCAVYAAIVTLVSAHDFLCFCWEQSFRVYPLMTWLEAFKECFGHRAQVLALRRYVQGLLSDSARKSMEAMLARVTEPGSYQAFQHFITDAPWDTECVWRRLRARDSRTRRPADFRRHQLSETGKTLGRGGAAVLRGGGQDRQLSGGGDRRAVDRGARLFARRRAVPPGRVVDGLGAHRARGCLPAIRFQEKWRQALTLLRHVRASGLTMTGVLADAEFGDIGVFRAMLHRLRLPYAVGISSHLTIFRGTPRLDWPPTPRHGRPRQHPDLASGVEVLSVAARRRDAPPAMASGQLAQSTRGPSLDGRVSARPA